MENAPQLRPLSVGEILDKALRIYRSLFIELIEIVAVALVPTTVLQIGSIIFFRNTTVVDFIQNFFVINLITIALMAAISKAYLKSPIGIGEAFLLGVQRFLPVLGGLIRQGFGIGGVAALIFICAALSGGAGGILFIIFIPFAIYFYTRWGVMIPSILIEDIGGGEGLGRSWALTSGNVGRVFGTTVLANLLVLIIAEIPGLLMIYALSFFALQAEISLLLVNIISQLTIILTLPISAAVTTLLYYDLRVRREGYDLELMVEAMQAG